MVSESDALPPEPVHVTVYVVELEGVTLTLPEVWLPVEKLVPVQLVAFVEFHVSVDD